MEKEHQGPMDHSQQLQRRSLAARGLPFLLAAAVLCPAQDARSIVQRSLQNDSTNSERARNYTFLEKSVEKKLDGEGRVTSTSDKLYDITILYGTPYRRLIQRDGKPLPERDASREEERFQKAVAKREKESQEERGRRLAREQKDRERQRAFLKEIPEAFHLALEGKDAVAGRPAFRIRAVPRPAYKPKDRAARILTKFQGRLWIDKDTYQWVRTEAETIDTVSFGLGLVRLAKGARLTFEQTRVNDEVWLPSRVLVNFQARLGLVKKLREEMEMTYSNYRKFQADSRIVQTVEAP